MNLSSIKTTSEVYDIGDVWYQRAHKLRIVWQNQNETEQRRKKAFLLWKQMSFRVIKVANHVSDINNKPKHKFERGGI